MGRYYSLIKRQSRLTYLPTFISVLRRHFSKTQKIAALTGLMVLVIGMLLHFALLRSTRSNDGWIDLKIYRQAGELVASRINPYDEAQIESSRLAEVIRTRDDLYDPWASSPANFDYYVTSNLPGSTLFFGALAWKGNSPLLWRLVLLGGLAALFLSAADYERRARGGPHSRCRFGRWVPFSFQSHACHLGNSPA
jgi:hypothetical protein